MQEIIEAARTGTAEDAEVLIRAVWPRAYRIALSVVRETALAEDAAQEACSILFRSIRTLRSSAAFSAWFYRIVVREALALEKRNRPAFECAVDAEHNDLDGSLRKIDLLAALERLTPAQRVVVALYYYAELTSPEIAEALGIADSSVRFHLMRGKRSLEKVLRQAQDFGSLGDRERREVAHGVA